MNNTVGIIVIYALIIAALMVPTILSNKKKRAQQKALMDGLKKNDKVITIGGIHGRVLEVYEDRVDIELDARGSRMTVSKTAIASSNSSTK